MQLAKDKIDRAIAGLDADWQASREQAESRSRSEARQLEVEEDSDKDKRADAKPTTVVYEGGNRDGRADD